MDLESMVFKKKILLLKFTSNVQNFYSLVRLPNLQNIEKLTEMAKFGRIRPNK